MPPPPTEPAALDDLLAQAGWVRALARRLAQDASHADDLAQGTLTAALESRPPRGRSLRPWLARVLANLLRKEYRGATRRESREREAARSIATPSADQLADQLEQQRVLAGLVADLCEPYRSVVLRRFYRGESAAQIARDTGVPAGTVRSQLARGLDQLREQLESRTPGDHARFLGLLALASDGPPADLSSSLTASTGVLIMTGSAKFLTAATLVALTAIGAWYLNRDEPSASPESETTLAELVPEPAPVVTHDEASTESRDRTDTHRSPAPTRERREDSPAGQVEVAATATPTVVQLHAVTREGLAVEGAWLEAVDEQGLPRPFAPSSPSGPDGLVTLTIAPGMGFRYFDKSLVNAYLALRAPNLATVYFVGIGKRDETKDLGEFVLHPGGGVSGRVVDSSGRGIGDAIVLGLPEHLTAGLDASRLQLPSFESGQPMVLTGADGAFVLDGLKLGASRLIAYREGSPWTLGDPLTIVPGTRQSGLYLQLDPRLDSARIRGVVVDATGVGVVGAEVLWQDLGVHEERQVTTESGGLFTIPATHRGVHRLLGRDPEERHGPAVVVEARPGDADVLLQLSTARRLNLRVVDESGDPLPGAYAGSFLREGDYLGHRFIHANDEGRIQLVADAQPFQVSVLHKGYERQRLGPFDPESLPPSVEVVLEALPTIHGIVRSKGKPVASAHVELVTARNGDWHEVYKGFPTRYFSNGQAQSSTDEEGRFVIALDGLGDGKGLVLLADKDGFALTEHPLGDYVPQRFEDPVQVELDRGGRLEGRVLVAGDRGHAGIVIAASRGDGRSKVTRTDASGRYRFQNLTPGPWLVEDRAVEPEGRTLSMVNSEDMPFRWNTQVVEGEATTFDIDLRWQDDLAVRGSLRFNGLGAEGWTAVLEEGKHTDRPYDLHSVTIDASGEFSVEALPGRGTLVLRSPASEARAQTLRVDLEVDAETGRFDYDLPTGDVDGKLDSGPTKLAVMGSIDANTKYSTSVTTDADGSFRIEGLPAVELGLQHRGPGPVPEEWRRLRFVVVAAGSLTTFE